MSKTLKINGATAVPVSAIRKIKPITAEDRERIAGRYDGIDASKFQIQIEFADKSTKLAAESLDDIKGQGVALVNLGSDRYVPATNIKTAQAFTKEDAEKAKGKDYTLNATFRSRVETTAGAMLSTATPAQVIERREKAIETIAQSTKATGPIKTVADAEAAVVRVQKKSVGPKAPANE